MYEAESFKAARFESMSQTKSTLKSEIKLVVVERRREISLEFKAMHAHLDRNWTVLNEGRSPKLAQGKTCCKLAFLRKYGLTSCLNFALTPQ